MDDHGDFLCRVFPTITFIMGVDFAPKDVVDVVQWIDANRMSDVRKAPPTSAEDAPTVEQRKSVEYCLLLLKCLPEAPSIVRC